MEETRVTLADLRSGEIALIVDILCTGPLRQRLSDFGFRPGEAVKVIRLAPLADPIQLSIRGNYVSLRRSEASLIGVARTS